MPPSIVISNGEIGIGDMPRPKDSSLFISCQVDGFHPSEVSTETLCPREFYTHQMRGTVFLPHPLVSGWEKW